MSKAGLELKDFSIAARRTEPATEVMPDVSALRPATANNFPPMLSKPNEQQRRDAAETRARAQEDTRYSLKNMKRAKQRHVKFFVNVALDYEMKARLQRAALENDLKMTAIVKAALDYYLSENGY
ncbi:hypothetical protein [Phyllobacterium endophyticum]|uniref:hypothetical protein n=1 Tax=Phyllobacterium endophyticum TaxID=1149773 RepID=UPI001FF04310|nr:hypothetical protein [Phyllobacterium endophyticum]